MKYVIYARKSTEDKKRQALSISAQISEMEKIAKTYDLEVVKVFSESKSAKAPGREKFNELLKFIEDGNAQGIITWKMDRLARNPIDEGQIKWLLENNIIKEIRTYEKTYRPEDNVLLAGIEFSMANQYIKDLSVNIKRGNRAKLESGELPGRAPFGYLNDKLNKKIVVNEAKRTPLQKTFRKYATGGYSLKQMVDESFNIGLMTDGGKKIYKSILHRILSNPFYYGVIKRNGNYYKGNHEAIISQKLFDEVQEVLSGKTQGRRKKHFYTYRSFLTCEKCGCALTADKKKGLTYYYCTNGKGGCEEHKKYLRSEFVDNEMAKVFNQIFFKKELIESIAKASSERIANDHKENGSLKLTLEKKLIACKLKQEALLDCSLDRMITKELFARKMKQLEKDQIDLETLLYQKQAKGKSTFEQTKKVFLMANKAQKEFLKQTDEQKRKTLEILLSNVSIESQQMAKIRFKMPYQFLANAPKNGDFTQLLGKRDSNPR